MTILKFSEFISENIDNITETDIHHTVSEIYDSFITDIFNEITDKYDFRTNMISPKNINDIKELTSKLIDISVDIIRSNIDDSFRVGDVVVDDSNNEHTIERLGQDDTFYNSDNENISFDDVRK